MKSIGRAARIALKPALIALLAGGALGACSLMPHERARPPALPSAWRDAPVGENISLRDWWTQFNDPLLTQLVTEALQDGPSVRLAAYRVREARAVAHSTLAGTLPDFTATGTVEYNEALHSSANFPRASGGTDSEQAIGVYGPHATWEVPLFGRIFQAAAAARGNSQSALADARGAQVALVADVAQAYVDLRAAQNSRTALEESVHSAEQLATILETSAHAGIAAEADAADARRLAESSRARLAALVIEERRAGNVLAVLRGRAPGAETASMQQSLDQVGGIPSVALSGAPTAPADMLRLRPDVAHAEAQVLIARAALGSARTDLLPQLNITGAINISHNLIGQPLSEPSENLSVTPFISVPLFNWGARIAQARVRNAQFHEALITYQQTVTQAISDGSNALAQLDQGAHRLEASRAAEHAAEITARGRRAAYEAGIASLVDRLRADQDLIDARLSRINAEAQEASAAIAVYRAFGGGPAVAIH